MPRSRLRSCAPGPASTRLVLGALLTQLLLSTLPVARAEPPKAAPDPAARSAFEAGADAYDHGRFADALREFERAYQLSPHPKLLFNIGRAADGDGQSERAISAYRSYLQAFPEAENREFVQSRIDKLDRLPTPAQAAPNPAVSLAPADVAAASLASQPQAPAPADDGGKPPVWKRGWFWGAVGGVVAVAVIVGVAVAVAGHGDSGGGRNRGRNPDESVQTLLARPAVGR